jgi:hypothetical protein
LTTLIIAVVQVSDAGYYANRLSRLLSNRFSFKEDVGETRIIIGAEDEPLVLKTKSKTEAIAQLDRSFQANQNFGCYLIDSQTKEEISLFAEGNELVVHLFASMELLTTNYEKIIRDLVDGLGYKVDAMNITME